jgi:hypothetical protein
MKKSLLTSVFVLGFVCFTQVVLAASFPPPPPPPPAPTPIDGGIALLVVGGISYVSKKAYDKRKNNNA